MQLGFGMLMYLSEPIEVPCRLLANPVPKTLCSLSVLVGVSNCVYRRLSIIIIFFLPQCIRPKTCLAFTPV